MVKKEERKEWRSHRILSNLIWKCKLFIFLSFTECCISKDNGNYTSSLICSFPSFISMYHLLLRLVNSSFWISFGRIIIQPMKRILLTINVSPGDWSISSHFYCQKWIVLHFQVSNHQLFLCLLNHYSSSRNGGWWLAESYGHISGPVAIQFPNGAYMKALDNGKFMLGAPHGDGEVGLLDIRHAPGDHNHFRLKMLR